MHARARLKRAGIPFEQTERGAHLVIRHAGRTVDFWPCIGVWIDRAHKRRRLGVRGLIQHLIPGKRHDHHSPRGAA